MREPRMIRKQIPAVGLLLQLLLINGSCNIIKQDRRKLEDDVDGDSYLLMDHYMEELTPSPVIAPVADFVRVPPAYDKLEELKEQGNAGVNSNSRLDLTETDIIDDGVKIDRNREQTTQAPTIEDMLDDDYNVVILDDEVPWDLTEDSPEKNQNSERAEIPTESPTIPAQIESEEEYLVIVLEDDVPWDDAAVAEYVEDVTNANSNSSAEELYFYDDDDEYLDDLKTPQFTHTSSPTSSPKPTALVSTREPTFTPTKVPTERPSAYPSNLPTNSPSDTPSASPTLSCYDKKSYRSPINRLTCSKHSGTNCLNWRHIGLNMTELETLVTSCPITCNIECGSFQLFSAPVSFRISRVSGFMDPVDVDALIEFSIDFLEGFVRDYIGNANTIIHGNNFPIADTSVSPRMYENSVSNDLDGELGNENSETGEKDFLTSMVRGGGMIMFEIEAAVLTSQNLVEDNIVPVARLEVLEDEEMAGNNSSRLLRSRSLQDLQRTKQQSSGGESIVKTDKALDVKLTFDGFTIGLNPALMSEFLVFGIDSVDFTRELQQSRIDFFSEATVSSAMETTEEDLFIEVDPDEAEGEKNSKFSVVISYLVPIVVIGFALGSLFYHKCYAKGRWSLRYNSRHQNAIERAQIGGMTATPMAASPINSITADSDGGSDGGYFNFRRQSTTSFNTFDENENERTKPNGGNKAEGGQSTFTRLISVLNLTLTKSKNSTDEEDNYEAEDTSHSPSSKSNDNAENVTNQQEIIPNRFDALVSPMSGDSEKSEGVSTDDNHQYKAYANVLPPMIVIDNIDGPEIDATSPVMRANSSTTGNSNGMTDPMRSSSTPFEDLDAFASEFRKQLIRGSSNGTNSKQQSLNGSFYGVHSPSALDLGLGSGPLFIANANSDDEDDGRLIKDIISDEWDGDDLFSPIPSNITTNEGEEDEEDSLPKPEDTSSSSESDEEESFTSPPINTPVETSKKSCIFGNLDGSPSTPEAVPNFDSKISASYMPAVSHRVTDSDVSLPRDRAALPPKHPPTPERGSYSLRPIVSEQQHRRSSFPKFAPIARALISGGSSSQSSHGGEGHRRKSSSDTAPDLIKNSSSISALSTDDLMIGGSKSESSNQNISTLEFEAPREGNWGLLLESSSKTGPRIYAVKEYSPLYGLVQKGDKLLEIDGKNVSQSKLADVTKLLKGKSSSYPYHRSTSSTMPIVVSRSTIPSFDLSVPPPSFSGYNNSSSSKKDRHNLHPQYADSNHRRKNSLGSYCSSGSSGSRVVEDVDGDNSNNKNSNKVSYLDHYHNKQENHLQHHPLHPQLDYDSFNEI